MDTSLRIQKLDKDGQQVQLYLSYVQKPLLGKVSQSVMRALATPMHATPQSRQLQQSNIKVLAFEDDLILSIIIFRIQLPFSRYLGTSRASNFCQLLHRFYVPVFFSLELQLFELLVHGLYKFHGFDWSSFYNCDSIQYPNS